MQDRIRVGIIGAGWWAAQTHARDLKATGCVDIVAACRRSPERLAEFAEKVGVPQTFTEHEAMLDEAELDAIVVCSPHGLHYQHVKSALDRGLPVLSDKPLAVTGVEADELVALADAKGVKLAVYFGHAYDSTFRYVGERIRSGALGRLVDASISCYANPDALGFFGNAEFRPNPSEFVLLPTPFRADADLGGGGYLQDMGSHAFSGMLIGTGLRVVQVSAQMDRTDVDLRTVVTLRFTNGATGTIVVAGDVQPRSTGYWGTGRFAFTGDLGGYWREPSSRLRYQEWGTEPVDVSDDDLPARTNPDENFIQALRGEAELIAPGSAAVECVRAIEAAYTSAKTGRTITLRQVQ